VDNAEENLAQLKDELIEAQKTIRKLRRDNQDLESANFVLRERNGKLTDENNLLRVDMSNLKKLPSQDPKPGMEAYTIAKRIERYLGNILHQPDFGFYVTDRDGRIAFKNASDTQNPSSGFFSQYLAKLRATPLRTEQETRFQQHSRRT
jgi:hypothetical protein